MNNFNNIYSENLTKISNYISYKVSNSFAAEEITSLTFIKVSKYVDSFDSKKSSITTWLINIANSCISDYFRKENKHINNLKLSDYQDEDGKEFIQLESSTTANELIESKELNLAITKAFNTLKPNYREIGDLFFIQEMKYTEIMVLLDLPMGSVKGMISRCRKQLQSELSKVKEQYI